MDSHITNLNHNKEELSVEKVLADLHRSVQSDIVPEEIDVQTIASRAVEKYWADREKGIIDREGEPIDDNAMLLRLASRRMINPWQEFITEASLTLGLPLLVTLLILFSPSNAEVIHSKKFSGVIAVLLATLAILACYIAVRTYRRHRNDIKYGRSFVITSMGSLVGGLAAASLAAVISGYVWHQEMANQQAKKELEIATQRLEEARLNSEAATLILAKDFLIDVSRVKIEEKLKTGSFETTPQQPETVQLSNKKNMQIVPKRISHDKLEYEANSEELAAPLQVKIDKDSGEVSVLKDGNSEEQAKIYVGIVEAASEKSVTLKVKNELGTETSITLSLSTWVSKPTKGEKVFVAFDPKTNFATRIKALNIKPTVTQGADKKSG